LVLSGAAYRSKLALESLQKRPIQSEIPAIVSMQVERIKNKIAANEKLSVAEAAQAVGQSVGSDGWMDGCAPRPALSFLCLVERAGCWLPIRSTWNTADAAFIEFARAKIITSSIWSAFSARQSGHSLWRF
jgi:hypothetical protein